jgi:MFS family permease
MLGQFLLGPVMVLPNVALSVMFISIWHLPAAVSPALFAINTVLVALLQAPFTVATARISRAARIWAAASLIAICLLSLAVVAAPGAAMGWAYVLGAGVLLAFADMLYLPSTNAGMVEAPAPHLRGRALSVFQTAFALSMALYPSIIGLLHSGLPWLLWVLTTLAIIGGAMSYTVAIRQIERGVAAHSSPVS